MPESKNDLGITLIINILRAEEIKFILLDFSPQHLDNSLSSHETSILLMVLAFDIHAKYLKLFAF